MYQKHEMEVTCFRGEEAFITCFISYVGGDGEGDDRDDD